MLCLCRIQVLEIAQARGYPSRWHRLYQKVGRFASRTLSVEPPGIVPADVVFGSPVGRNHRV